MSGKRSNNEDLKGFPYLDREPDGRYSIRHPKTRRRASLKTRDFDKAISRYNVIMSRWQSDQGDQVANTLADRMGEIAEASVPGTTAPTVAQFAAEWRERWLNVQIVDSARGRHGKSQYLAGPCKVVSEHTKKYLSDRTALDYAKFCYKFFEQDPVWQKLPINVPNAAQQARQALSKYNTKPTSYNHHLHCLITMLQQAKRDGLIRANWAREIDPLIKPAATPEQKALRHIPPADYANIRSHLVNATYMGKKRNGEWLGRTCDLLLCMSSRPAEAVGLRDDAFDDQGHLRYRANKTGTHIDIEDESGTLAATVQWLRGWKKYNHIISPHLIVYPGYFPRDLAGKPVTPRYVSRQFSKAVVQAGYPKGRWVFRNLRHTGISTEEAQQGEGANKGAHKSQSGQAPYRTSEPVTRVKNTIELEHLKGPKS